MHLKPLLLGGLIAAGLLAAPRSAAAQPARDQPGVKNFDPTVVVGDDNGELRSTLKREYEQADTAVRQYMDQSVAAIQEGHRMGFQHFAVWYRNYENRKKSSADAIAKEIFKQLLPGAFKIIFPEAEFIEVMGKIVEGVVAVGEKALEVPEGDVNLFLEQLRTAEEKQIAKALDTPQEFATTHHDEYSAAVLEYLELRLQDPNLLNKDAQDKRAADAARDPKMLALPASVLQMLGNMGVPPPGSKTATQVAEGVLEFHIYEIMIHDDTWRGMWPYSEHEFAKAHALQEMDAEGNKKRICETERSWTYFRTIPAPECAPLLRR